MSVFYALGNETNKTLRIYWNYRTNLIMEIVLFGAVFSGMALWLGTPEGGGRIETRSSLLVAFLIWAFYNAALGTMMWGIRDETTTGTMEQMGMGLHPVVVLVFGRVIGRTLVTLVQTVIMGGALLLILNESLPMSLDLLPVIVLTMMGVHGFAYILGGLTLVFKRVESFNNLLGNIVLFLNGSFVAIDKYPQWLETIGRIVPTTQGIVVMRQIMFEKMTLAQTWDAGSLQLLVIHSVVMFAIGVGFFRWMERIAKQRGTLGQY